MYFDSPFGGNQFGYGGSQGASPFFGNAPQSDYQQDMYQLQMLANQQRNFYMSRPTGYGAAMSPYMPIGQSLTPRGMEPIGYQMPTFPGLGMMPNMLIQMGLSSMTGIGAFSAFGGLGRYSIMDQVRGRYDMIQSMGAQGVMPTTYNRALQGQETERAQRLLARMRYATYGGEAEFDRQKREESFRTDMQDFRKRGIDLPEDFRSVVFEANAKRRLEEQKKEILEQAKGMASTAVGTLYGGTNQFTAGASMLGRSILGAAGITDWFSPHMALAQTLGGALRVMNPQNALGPGGKQIYDLAAKVRDVFYEKDSNALKPDARGFNGTEIGTIATENARRGMFIGTNAEEVPAKLKEMVKGLDIMGQIFGRERGIPALIKKLDEITGGAARELTPEKMNRQLQRIQEVSRITGISAPLVGEIAGMSAQQTRAAGLGGMVGYNSAMESMSYATFAMNQQGAGGFFGAMTYPETQGLIQKQLTNAAGSQFGRVAGGFMGSLVQTAESRGISGAKNMSATELVKRLGGGNAAALAYAKAIDSGDAATLLKMKDQSDAVASALSPITGIPVNQQLQLLQTQTPLGQEMYNTSIAPHARAVQTADLERALLRTTSMNGVFQAGLMKLGLNQDQIRKVNAAAAKGALATGQGGSKGAMDDIAAAVYASGAGVTREQAAKIANLTYGQYELGFKNDDFLNQMGNGSFLNARVAYNREGQRQLEVRQNQEKVMSVLEEKFRGAGFGTETFARRMFNSIFYDSKTSSDAFSDIVKSAAGIHFNPEIAKQMGRFRNVFMAANSDPKEAAEFLKELNDPKIRTQADAKKALDAEYLGANGAKPTSDVVQMMTDMMNMVTPGMNNIQNATGSDIKGKIMARLAGTDPTMDTATSQQRESEYIGLLNKAGLATNSKKAASGDAVQRAISSTVDAALRGEFKTDAEFKQHLSDGLVISLGVTNQDVFNKSGLVDAAMKSAQEALGGSPVAGLKGTVDASDADWINSPDAKAFIGSDAHKKFVENSKKIIRSAISPYFKDGEVDKKIQPLINLIKGKQASGGVNGSRMSPEDAVAAALKDTGILSGKDDDKKRQELAASLTSAIGDELKADTAGSTDEHLSNICDYTERSAIALEALAGTAPDKNPPPAQNSTPPTDAAGTSENAPVPGSFMAIADTGAMEDRYKEMSEYASSGQGTGKSYMKYLETLVSPLTNQVVQETACYDN